METDQEAAARELEEKQAEYKRRQAELDKKLQDTFLQACYTGDIEEINQCIKDNVDMDACDSNGRTGLFQTISSGANLVDLLLNEGAEIEWIDKSGETALIHAAKILNVKSIKILCAWGCDVNAKDKKGSTALHYIFQFILSRS